MKQPPTGSASFQQLNQFPRTQAHIQCSPAVERESDLHQQIEAWCKERGYYYIHSRMDRRTTTAKGVADFVIFAPAKVFCVECKRKGSKPTPQQLAAQAHLRKLGHISAIVYTFDEFLSATNP